MTAIFVVVLWIAVSILCLRAMNEDKGLKEDWKQVNPFIKLCAFVGMPLFYILAVLGESFEK